MKRTQVWISVAMIGLMALAIGSAQATMMWLSTDAAGTSIPGGSVSLGSGEQLTLYCFMESAEIGNTFEIMVGYDTSDAATYGAGVDTNNGASKKLTLSSQKSEIIGTLPASFNVFSQAGYSDAQVVLDASGREASNVVLGGRPYGFIGRAATTTNAACGKVMCFSFALHNNMTTNGDTQHVVISNQTGGNSHSSAWKHGTILFEDSYSLLVVNGSAVEKDVVGATGKSLKDTLAKDVAGDYDWVLWGIAHVVNANTFTIDDGSGVIVTVNATGHGVTEGKYVSVKGSLSFSGDEPTITTTSDKITPRN